MWCRKFRALTQSSQAHAWWWRGAPLPMASGRPAEKLCRKLFALPPCRPVILLGDCMCMTCAWGRSWHECKHTAPSVLPSQWLWLREAGWCQVRAGAGGGPIPLSHGLQRVTALFHITY